MRRRTRCTQHAVNDTRICSNDMKQKQRCTVWLVSPLLPIFHRVDLKPESQSKVSLRKAQFISD